MSGRARRWLAALAVAVGAGGIAALFAITWYEPGWRYDVRGVDVSHHQGPIDWPALAADDDVDFAFVKATEGGGWTDPRFAKNWEAAGATGLLRGAYHFFTLCRSGADQAAHLIATVPREPGMLPPAVDLEFTGNCAARPPVEVFRSELDDFLAAVEEHYGVAPIAYVTPRFYRTYLADDPPDLVWWARSGFWEPWGSPRWTFWQSWPGRRAGVDGDVDRNVFDGNLAELYELALPD